MTPSNIKQQKTSTQHIQNIMILRKILENKINLGNIPETTQFILNEIYSSILKYPYMFVDLVNKHLTQYLQHFNSPKNKKKLTLHAMNIDEQKILKLMLISLHIGNNTTMELTPKMEKLLQNNHEIAQHILKAKHKLNKKLQKSKKILNNILHEPTLHEPFLSWNI